VTDGVLVYVVVPDTLGVPDFVGDTVDVTDDVIDGVTDGVPDLEGVTDGVPEFVEVGVILDVPDFDGVTVGDTVDVEVTDIVPVTVGVIVFEGEAPVVIVDVPVPVFELVPVIVDVIVVDVVDVTVGLTDGVPDFVGDIDGVTVGLTDGVPDLVGDTEGVTVGLTDGVPDFVGDTDGVTVGLTDGVPDLVGDTDGVTVGLTDGVPDLVGDTDGVTVGLTDDVPDFVGETVGVTVGLTDGVPDLVGDTDGVPELVDVTEAVTVGLTDGVLDLVGDTDDVTVGLTDGVPELVDVTDGVIVLVGVAVKVLVKVASEDIEILILNILVKLLNPVLVILGVGLDDELTLIEFVFDTLDNVLLLIEGLDVNVVVVVFETVGIIVVDTTLVKLLNPVFVLLVNGDNVGVTTDVVLGVGLIDELTLAEFVFETLDIVLLLIDGLDVLVSVGIIVLDTTLVKLLNPVFVLLINEDTVGVTTDVVLGVGLIDELTLSEFVFERLDTVLLLIEGLDVNVVVDVLDTVGIIVVDITLVKLLNPVFVPLVIGDTVGVTTDVVLDVGLIDELTLAEFVLETLDDVLVLIDGLDVNVVVDVLDKVGITVVDTTLVKLLNPVSVVLVIGDTVGVTTDVVLDVGLIDELTLAEFVLDTLDTELLLIETLGVNVVVVVLETEADTEFDIILVTLLSPVFVLVIIGDSVEVTIDVLVNVGLIDGVTDTILVCELVGTGDTD